VLTDSKKIMMVGCFLAGAVCTTFGIYQFADTEIFVSQATSFQTVIVDVRYQYVEKGRGYGLGWVPIVENPLTHERRQVDTFGDKGAYKIGDRIDLLCNATRCILNGVFSKWGNSIVNLSLASFFLLAATFLRR
jgi:hypothetical protein